MKKIISLLVSAVMVLSMGVSVFGADLTMNIVDGTYKITVGPNDEIGYVTMENENGEVEDFIIMVGNGYGYLYFDNVNMNDIDIYNAELELVSEKDLGVSGLHIFEIVEGQRDFDPLVDEAVYDENGVRIIDYELPTDEDELAEIFA